MDPCAGGGRACPAGWSVPRDAGAGGWRISALLARSNCVQGFAPDHDLLAARGLTVTPDLPEGEVFAAALVQIVKAKAGTLGSIAEALGALRPGGVLMVDGQKEEGIESILKVLRGVFEIGGTFSKAHGKLVWLTRPEALPEAVIDWMPEPGGDRRGLPDRPRRLFRRGAGPRLGIACRAGAGADGTCG